MRKGGLQLCLILLGITGIHFFKILKSGYINGKISPADGAKAVVATNGEDSVRVTSEDGSFGMMVAPGKWKLIIEPGSGTRNVIMQQLTIREGQHADLGEIKLAD